VGTSAHHSAKRFVEILFNTSKSDKMKTSYNKTLAQILQSLDGKMAYVNSGGLSVSGSAEGTVKLSYVGEFWGVNCLIPLQWNEAKITGTLSDAVRNNNPTLKYYELGEVLSAISTVVDSFYVRAANISCYDVRSFTVSSDEDGEISELTIVYRGNNTIKILISEQ
jgi:hypothetical protein